MCKTFSLFSSSIWRYLFLNAIKYFDRACTDCSRYVLERVNGVQNLLLVSLFFCLHPSEASLPAAFPLWCSLASLATEERTCSSAGRRPSDSPTFMYAAYNLCTRLPTLPCALMGILTPRWARVCLIIVISTRWLASFSERTTETTVVAFVGIMRSYTHRSVTTMQMLVPEIHPCVASNLDFEST